MARMRKYLDRGRRIALEGRPFEVEWLLLLGLGKGAVQDGRADAAPLLSEVMWEGVSALPTFPRPALLDHPFLRSALDARENETIAYLAEQWSKAWVDPLPQDAAEARRLLDRPDCITAGTSAHLMPSYAAQMPEGSATWYTGFCASCMRAMLLRINDQRRTVEWWPFYDQETV